MSLSESERSIIVKREMEKAERTFEDVLFCSRENRWEAAANRLYYALLLGTMGSPYSPLHSTTS